MKKRCIKNIYIKKKRKKYVKKKLTIEKKYTKEKIYDKEIYKRVIYGKTNTEIGYTEKKLINNL